MVAEPGQVLLIQFARAPEPGAVKTRMLPHLSARQACDLHRELVVWTTRRLTSSGLGAVELAVAGDTGGSLFGECRASGVSAIYPQEGADLGERMYRAIRHGLARYDRVILVGSDCPWIDRAYLQAALRALEGAPVVRGPAVGGGWPELPPRGDVDRPEDLRAGRALRDAECQPGR